MKLLLILTSLGFGVYAVNVTAHWMQIATNVMQSYQ